MNKSFQAVILAGGASKRLGQNKALLKFNSSNLIQRIFIQAQMVVNDVHVIADPLDDNLIPRARFIPDMIKGVGPLGGILTALELSKKPCLILSCDMPFIMAEHIRYLLRHFSSSHHATVARSSDGIEPLFAIYKSEALPMIKKSISEERYAVHRFLKEISVNFLDFRVSSFNQHLFFNINTLSDYKKAVNLDSVDE